MGEDSVYTREDTGSSIRVWDPRMGCQDLVDELGTGVKSSVDVPAEALLQDVEVAVGGNDGALLQHQFTSQRGAVVIFNLKLSKTGGSYWTWVLFPPDALSSLLSSFFTRKYGPDVLGDAPSGAAVDEEGSGVGVFRHVSNVGEDFMKLTVSSGLLEGCDVSRGVCVQSSRAEVILLHAPPSLFAVKCGLPTLRVAESKVKEILGSSSPSSYYLDFFVVHCWKTMKFDGKNTQRVRCHVDVQSRHQILPTRSEILMSPDKLVRILKIACVCNIHASVCLTLCVP